MESEFRAALESSIRIWERRASGHIDNSPCPLCQLSVFSESDDDLCKGCPVHLHTGNSCAGTPFYEWSAAQENFDKENSEAAVLAAKKELEFLKSLME